MERIECVVSRIEGKVARGWRATGLVCSVGLALVIVALSGVGEGAKATGPLKVCERNSRYFSDGSGKAIYLTGSHTWNNLVDMGPSDPPPRFDFTACLDWMESLNHNFIRMWTWESTTWDTRGNNPAHRKKAPHKSWPQPYARTGPGKARDGKPKFDLKKYDGEYFRRLRSRVSSAGERGIYVSIMLFEGWGMQFSPGAWESHPFHPDNNVNGINGDVNGDGKGLEVHTLANPAVTALQEAYVRKVIDTVNDLDNVLYEISNENHPPSTKWQYHVIDFIHKYEKGKPKQHPVGMTFQYRAGSNRTLFESPAEWISPNPEGGYRDNPPAADGSKVVLTDTDHLWGIGGNQAWVWKSFTRGYNPIFMDPYRGLVLGNKLDPKFDPVRRSLGYTLRYARRMNLVEMRPRNGLASTKYCLANPGEEYLVYFPKGGSVTVDLSAAKGSLFVEWFNPSTGEPMRAKKITGGAKRDFTAPFTGDAVLYILSGRPTRRIDWQDPVSVMRGFFFAKKNGDWMAAYSCCDYEETLPEEETKKIREKWKAESQQWPIDYRNTFWNVTARSFKDDVALVSILVARRDPVTHALTPGETYLAKLKKYKGKWKMTSLLPAEEPQ